MKKVIFCKRCLTVLLCVAVFLGSFTVTSFAVSEDVFNPDDVVATQYKNWSELPDDFKALGEAYFNTFCNSDNPVSFFKNASEVPISWFKITKDSTPVLSPVGTLFYFLDGADLKVYDNSHYSSSHGHSRGVKPDEDFVVPADDFVDYVGTTEKMYFPKNAKGKMSYRTDERFQNYAVTHSSNYYVSSELYAGTKFGFSAVGGGNDMYMVLFENRGGNYYYSKYQFHLYITTEDIPFEDRDEIQYTNYTLNCEYWDMVDGSQEQSTKNVVVTSTYPYFELCYSGRSSQFLVKVFSTYDNFVGYTSASSGSCDVPNWVLLYNTDLSSSVNLSYSHCKGTYSTHDKNCTYNGNCDLGYLASSTPLNTLYTIETEKIPNNYYVTVSGDTIYDYSITNPETGQKDTIQNYVTNNYTFTTVNEDNTSGGGVTSGSVGGVGGDVNVGGNVQVGGSVDIGGKVDINVNVNSDNSGADNTSDDSEFEGTFNDYMQYVPEVSDGFIGYLKSFFSWLPPPVFGILMLGLIVSVWCRWRGR